MASRIDELDRLEANYFTHLRKSWNLNGTVRANCRRCEVVGRYPPARPLVVTMRCHDGASKLLLHCRRRNVVDLRETRWYPANAALSCSAAPCEATGRGESHRHGDRAPHQ